MAAVKAATPIAVPPPHRQPLRQLLDRSHGYRATEPQVRALTPSNTRSLDEDFLHDFKAGPPTAARRASGRQAGRAAALRPVAARATHALDVLT